VLDPFHYAFVQRGAVEALLLAVPAGLLGSWIVLRGLAFFAHAVGTAAFPGLVLADGLGWPGPAGAGLAAGVYTLGVDRVAVRRESDRDTLTGLVLVGALGLGAVLASDVFHSGSNVETLLFGSLLVVGRDDVRLAAVAAVLSVAGSMLFGRRWLAAGFDAASARSIGVRVSAYDALLLALVGFAVVAALSAVGALLAAALFVVPAATARLLVRTVGRLQALSVALVAVESIVGLWLSVELNVPPGPAIAVLAGAVFAVAALRRVAPMLALVALLAGCGGSNSSDGKLRVVATTTQIADWVREVGGPDVDVHQILQPNTDPHEYEPRPRDVEAVARADLIFENGDGLDAWMEKVVAQAGSHPRVIVLGDFVPVKLPSESSGRERSRFDPHWWDDPRNADAAVFAIGAALIPADAKHGKHGKAFARRGRVYRARIEALDRKLESCLARIPPQERKLVTNHDAFGYFAHRYGLEVVGAVIPSQTTQAQPSAGETARLVATIRREHVRAVFPESSINPSLADAIAREAGARSDLVLYGDTLGPAGSPGATYLGMELANADAIANGLSGGKVRCP
jgi:ABC-type Zn uptake system ZnuABC Zn-binding protein ZnuA/ABC-type Mn2+/Zn2+ transport system permease subunit